MNTKKEFKTPKNRVVPSEPAVKKKLGEAMVDGALITPQELELGLKEQSQLRKKRLGEIFVADGVTAPEDIHNALRIKKTHKAHLKLGALLLERGLISQEDLNAALAKQKQYRSRFLGEILVDMNIINGEMLALALALQNGLPYMDPRKFIVDEVAANMFSSKFLKRLKAFPVKLSKTELTVIVADPNSLDVEGDLRFHTGLNVKIGGIGSEHAILEAINTLYEAFTDKTLTGILPEAAAFDVEKVEDSEEEGYHITEETGREKPIIEIVNHILKTAVAKKASDIHIIPQGKIVKIKLRIDGMLFDELILSKERLPSVASRMKILADMDITERRLPQDGGTKIRVYGKTVDLRLSFLPTVYGQSIVIRLLNKENGLMRLEDMGFLEPAIKGLRRCIAKPYGMLLFTGPTGSGKSTTIYACLQESVFSDKNVITLENPVEYGLPGTCQVQIKEEIGLTFARGLRQILRHDPDVIVVGEMRDTETAKIGVRAALTGHLLITTLHTNTAAETFLRLGDMGINPYLVSSSILGVVSQRLIRKICPNCKEVDPDAALKLKSNGFPVAFSDNAIFYRGKGCDECHQTGYKGRAVVYEFIPTDEDIKKAIMADASAARIREIAIRNGIQTIEEIALIKAKTGIVSVDEIIPLVSVL
ncbi:MAG: Flp pilus assembly complex ATPase component TadA [Deltaproteobacteria bacterium]|nr:Flp pilus assembly complex ATPase component TadA [Deltaproteobacteria bacterium]